jgi:hypothetical protein
MSGGAMSRLKLFFIAAFVFLIVCPAARPILAHHGTPINYDAKELITSKATVAGLDFKNPHVALFFETTDEAGKVIRWSGEMAAPSVYLRDGWTKKRTEEELKVGTPITISYYISKVQEALPPGVGAALVVRIRNAKDERVLLDRR